VASQKLKLKHRASRKTFHNASVANIMTIHVHTVATTQDAFVVVNCTTLLYVKKIEMNLPNVPYAVACVQQIIKVVLSTRASLKHESSNLLILGVKIIQTLKNYSLLPIFENLPKINEHTNVPQNTPSPTHPATSNINEQLSSFINEFNLSINPLISLLTTVIDKLININGCQ